MSGFGSILTEKRNHIKNTDVVALINKVKLNRKKEKNKNIIIAAAAAAALAVSGFIISL